MPSLHEAGIMQVYTLEVMYSIPCLIRYMQMYCVHACMRSIKVYHND